MAKPVWTKQTITVQAQPMVYDTKAGAAPNGDLTAKDLDADVWGAFAVHKPINGFEYGVTVTHIPSGLSILRSAESKTKAKRFCREVADLTDWSSLTPENCRDRWPAIKERVIAAAHKARP